MICDICDGLGYILKSQDEIERILRRDLSFWHKIHWRENSTKCPSCDGLGVMDNPLEVSGE